MIGEFKISSKTGKHFIVKEGLQYLNDVKTAPPERTAMSNSLSFNSNPDLRSIQWLFIFLTAIYALNAS